MECSLCRARVQLKFLSVLLSASCQAVVTCTVSISMSVHFLATWTWPLWFLCFPSLSHLFSVSTICIPLSQKIFFVSCFPLPLLHSSCPTIAFPSWVSLSIVAIHPFSPPSSICPPPYTIDSACLIRPMSWELVSCVRDVGEACRYICPPPNYSIKLTQDRRTVVLSPLQCVSVCVCMCTYLTVFLFYYNCPPACWQNRCGLMK